MDTKVLGTILTTYFMMTQQARQWQPFEMYNNTTASVDPSGGDMSVSSRSTVAACRQTVMKSQDPGSRLSLSGSLWQEHRRTAGDHDHSAVSSSRPSGRDRNVRAVWLRRERIRDRSRGRTACRPSLSFNPSNARCRGLRCAHTAALWAQLTYHDTVGTPVGARAVQESCAILVSYCARGTYVT